MFWVEKISLVEIFFFFFLRTRLLQVTTFLRSNAQNPPQPPSSCPKETNKLSTHLLKTESGLLKARQQLCRASSPSSSSIRRPRVRPAMSAQDRGSGQWPSRWEGRAGGRSYFMAPVEGDARPARSAPFAPDAWEAALESAPPARGSRPPSRAPGRCSHRAGMSRVLIARKARGCEGYRADPRQSSFGTCKNRSR